MREYELTIDEALRNGLSPLYMTPFNAPYLYECKGFRCGAGGLEAFVTGENPIGMLPQFHTMQYVWPFPQFLTGERYNILVVRDLTNQQDNVYQLSDDMTTVTFAFSVDKLTFGTGTLMEVADFGSFAIMVNGVATIYMHYTGVWVGGGAAETIPTMRTICNFNGQAVGGGVTSEWYDCDETYYVWSDIGSINFVPGDRNEAGYRRCPFGGDVYHTRKLGKTIIGYSSKGIVAIFPATEPAPTLGFDEVISVGLCNRGALNGDRKRQLFVGEDYVIRELTPNGIKELGYKKQMKSLSDEDIIVTYDRVLNDFFFSNSTKTFLLSPSGMTEVQQHPSAVWRSNVSDLYMLPDDKELGFEPLITSEAMDMGYKGQKTAQVIESDVFQGFGPEATVCYTNNMIEWDDFDYIPLNDQGIATVIGSGHALRAKLKFDMIDENFRIGYIKMRYKMTDLRNIRGVYAPPPRGQ